MRAIRGGILLVFMASLALSACSRNKEPRLLNIKSSTSGPDEFAILPSKPLQQPDSFDALPTPTPGTRSLVDPTPNEDAIAALGGNPAVVARSGVPATDVGLINHASRFGVSTGIRQTLASEDLQFRQRKSGRPLEKLFGVNVYFRAYERQSLDKYAELERFRSRGIRTPAAPPPQP